MSRKHLHASDLSINTVLITGLNIKGYHSPEINMLSVLNSGWEDLRGNQGRQEAVVLWEMRLITCNTKTGVNMH